MVTRRQIKSLENKINLMVDDPTEIEVCIYERIDDEYCRDIYTGETFKKDKLNDDGINVEIIRA